MITIDHEFLNTSWTFCPISRHIEDASERFSLAIVNFGHGGGPPEGPNDGKLQQGAISGGDCDDGRDTNSKVGSGGMLRA